jgi:hypothetical protein
MSSVERIRVETVGEPPNYGVPPSAPPQVQPTPPQAPALNPVFQAQLEQVRRQSQINMRMVSILQAIAMIVSARLLLLLTTCFGFVLAIFATRQQTIESIAVLVAWAILIVLPLVVLDVLARQPRPAEPYQGAR